MFSQRVVDNWNKLPNNVVNASNVNIFKNQLNSHWKDFSVKFVPDFYGPEAGIRETVSKRIKEAMPSR